MTQQIGFRINDETYLRLSALAAEKGLSVLKKMNAAQFSKTFKGTLSRLKPSTRGTINRGINSGIDEINSTVGSGEVMFDAIDFLKPEDKE